LQRQIEVSIGNGKATPQACNEAGLTVWSVFIPLKQHQAPLSLCQKLY
jgi:hypothetical protein